VTKMKQAGTENECLKTNVSEDGHAREGRRKANGDDKDKKAEDLLILLDNES